MRSSLRLHKGVQATYVNIISYKCVFNGFNSPLPAVLGAILKEQNKRFRLGKLVKISFGQRGQAIFPANHLLDWHNRRIFKEKGGVSVNGMRGGERTLDRAGAAGSSLWPILKVNPLEGS